MNKRTVVNNWRFAGSRSSWGNKNRFSPLQRQFYSRNFHTTLVVVCILCGSECRTCVILNKKWSIVYQEGKMDLIEQATRAQGRGHLMARKGLNFTLQTPVEHALEDWE